MLVSEYRRDLRSLLEAKLQGEELARPEPLPAKPVVDLMALRRSVAEAKKRKSAHATLAKQKAAGRQTGGKRLRRGGRPAAT